MSKSLLTLAALATAATAASDYSGWATKSIYQVMTDRFARTDNSTDADCDLLKYCGGSWQGIINQLDYIQGMGFSAIQISPVVENIPEDTGYGEAYHGYWPQNLYALNDNFGTADDLKALSKALHDRDMFLMVDVVINDMAAAIDGVMPDQDIDYSKLLPFDDEKYYHSYCNISDYTNLTMEQDCWLGVENVALPDLDTESDTVADMIHTWIQQLVANYSIDGLRIDAAKHVNSEFLKPFVDAANVFTLGEVFDGIDLVCEYQNDGSLAGLPNFPVYYTIIKAFTAGNMSLLVDEVSQVEDQCNDFSLLGSFSENHDLPRIADYTSDLELASNVIAFTILADGIPTIYQGQEQHFSGNYSPYNRAPLWPSAYDTTSDLYNLTATLNRLRNHAIKIDSRYASNHSAMLYTDGSTYATSKGPDGVNIVSVFSNQGAEGGKYELVIPGAFDEGTKAVDVLDCSQTVTAAKGGNITVSMGGGKAHAFFPAAQMNGSGLCGYKDTESAAATATASSTGSAASASSTKKGAAVRLGLEVQNVVFVALAAAVGAATFCI